MRTFYLEIHKKENLKISDSHTGYGSGDLGSPDVSKTLDLFVSLQTYLHGDDGNLTYLKFMDSSNFEYNQRGNVVKQTWFEYEKHQAHTWL